MEPTLLAWTAGAALVVIGLVGLIVPVLPGTLLVFAGLFLAAWGEGFAYVGWPTLVVIGLMGLGTFAVDSLASALGAKRVGASRRAVAGALLGALVGLFFGFVGILVGPLVGAILGELWARRSVSSAGKVGFGTAVGLVVGTVAKLALAFSMVALFLLDRFFLGAV